MFLIDNFGEYKVIIIIDRRNNRFLSPMWKTTELSVEPDIDNK